MKKICWRMIFFIFMSGFLTACGGQRAEESRSVPEADLGEDPSQNRFAVQDVDLDGKPELLIRLDGASTMAGTAGYVFAYDPETDSYKEELSEWVSMEFYENGYVKVDMSHSHGLAGSKFWPYTLYRYEEEGDTYVGDALIDAWEKELFPQDFHGNPFPDEIDESRTGVIYYIHEGSLYDPETKPSDASVYGRLLERTLGKAEKQEIAYQSLTMENIERVCP